MFSQKPEMAQEFAAKTPDMGALPEKVKGVPQPGAHLAKGIGKKKFAIKARGSFVKGLGL